MRRRRVDCQRRTLWAAGGGVTKRGEWEVAWGPSRYHRQETQLQDNSVYFYWSDKEKQSSFQDKTCSALPYIISLRTVSCFEKPLFNRLILYIEVPVWFSGAPYIFRFINLLIRFLKGILVYFNKTYSFKWISKKNVIPRKTDTVGFELRTEKWEPILVLEC